MDIFKQDTKTEVLRAYLECALWSSVDDNDEYFDSFSMMDIAETDISDAMNDVEGFLELIDFDKLNLDAAGVGHDFLLTRNGHGAGFWDRGYDEKLETILMDAAKSFSEVWLYIGDDQKLHFT